MQGLMAHTHPVRNYKVLVARIHMKFVKLQRNHEDCQQPFPLCSEAFRTRSMTTFTYLGSLVLDHPIRFLLYCTLLSRRHNGGHSAIRAL